MNDIQPEESLLAAFAPLYNSIICHPYPNRIRLGTLSGQAHHYSPLSPLVKPLQLKAHDVYHRFIREADWHGTFVENCAEVPKKRNASFTDALASLCKTLWRKRNISMTGKSSAPSKILNTVIDL
jgi:hypothetical protein